MLFARVLFFDYLRTQNDRDLYRRWIVVHLKLTVFNLSANQILQLCVLQTTNSKVKILSLVCNTWRKMTYC